MSKSLAMEIDILERLNAACKAQEDRVWAAIKAERESSLEYTSNLQIKVMTLESQNRILHGTVKSLNDLVNQLRAALNGVLADFPKAVWLNRPVGDKPEVYTHDMAVKRHHRDCQCARCKPLERPCDCQHCREYRSTRQQRSTESGK